MFCISLTFKPNRDFYILSLKVLPVFQLPGCKYKSAFLRVLASDLVRLTLGLVLPPVGPLARLPTVVDLAAAPTGTGLLTPTDFTRLDHFAPLEADRETTLLTVSLTVSVPLRQLTTLS